MGSDSCLANLTHLSVFIELRKIKAGAKFCFGRVSETQRVLGTNRELEQNKTKWRPKAGGLPNDIYRLSNTCVRFSFGKPTLYFLDPVGFGDNRDGLSKSR